jgi:GNAT superfamily N-acetyltransferase
LSSLSAPETLRDDHDVSTFNCGKPALDNWLRQRAKSNQRLGFTAVVVVHEAMRVAGFYGLTPSTLDRSHLPRAIRTGQPPDPIPCLLLAQLATDIAYARRGIGKGLLGHAFRRSLAAAKLIGGRVLVVHALDDEAAEFWRRRGFVPSKTQPMLLFQAMTAIAESVATVDPDR